MKLSILVKLCCVIVRLLPFGYTQEYLEIPALNRPADIGHLYNQITDTFFLVKAQKGRFPANYTEFVRSPLIDYKYKRVWSFSDKLESFSLDASTQASLLFGMVEAGGTFTYLTEANLDLEHSYAALKYKTTIATELLTLYRPEVLQKIDTDIGRVMGATHIIIGVEWGTDALFSMKWRSNTKDLMDSSSASMNAAITSSKYSGQISSSFDSLKKSLDKSEDLEVSYYGNIAMGKTSVKSFEDIEDYMMTVPNLTKTVNGGKGSPMKFIAISLERMDDLMVQGNFTWTETQEIESHTVEQDVNLYKLHNKMKNQYQQQQDLILRLNRLLSTATKHDDLFPTEFPYTLKNEIGRFQEVCGIFSIKIKHLLKSARNSTHGILEMYDDIEKNYQEDPNGPNSFEEIKKSIPMYEAKVDTKLRVSKYGVFYLKKTESLAAVRIQNQRKSTVQAFITTSRSKAVGESVWYFHLDKFVNSDGFKLYVDCDLPEIYNSSCVAFSERLMYGPVLQKYNKNTRL